MYFVKRDIHNKAVMLIRKTDSALERLDPEGWVPTANLEWTGIGGSADWDEVTEDGAAVAPVNRFRGRVALA